MRDDKPTQLESHIKATRGFSEIIVEEKRPDPRGVETGCY